MGLAPGPSKGGFCGTTIERRKPLDSHLGLFRLARPLLGESFGCSPPDLGCLIRARPPVRGGKLPGGGPLERGLGPRLEPTRGPGRAEPPLVVRSALGAKCFQPTSPGGQGRPICSPRRPARRQRWGGSRRGVGENCVGVAPRQRPDRRGALALKPVGARSWQRRGDSTGVSHPAAPVAPEGASCAASLSLGGASFRGIDNDPSAGSPHGNLVQWTFIALSANRQRRPRSNTSPDHSIGRAAGGVYKGQGRSQRADDFAY
ncbi:hypothetical protein H6P81_021324 [Aristolochia fimbriata]|uniref:Uncharacterized protein n=1 Tax=Aristolochia fimbriata TaxID=158543 RepID=A0AAV7DRU4_ARIFI|nr:hypothetical protein H6P81_021324 [Aristolochia fimbriata]